MNRILFILLILTSGYAAAQSEADFLLLQKDYILHPDGSSDLHCRQVVKYHTHVSFNRLYGETFVVYNPQHQQLKINESYTIQASGNKITAPENAFNEVLPRFAADAPAYNHLREMVVTHTGLEIGATAYLSYTLHTKAGYEPELDQYLLLQESDPVKEYKVSVSVPDNKKLSYQLHAAKGNPKTSRKDNATVYEWTFRNIAATSKESYQPADNRNTPCLIFTTWTSQGAALQWLATQMKAGNTAQIKSQIEKTAKSNREDQSIALGYDFLVHQIAYTPVPACYSGYRMREASQVLHSAYGTACEKTSLMLAAASQMGLTAYPVAVYPSFMDGSVGSLAAIQDFAVSVNAGSDFLVSPTAFTGLSLTNTKPGYRYVLMTQGSRVITPGNSNNVSVAMLVDINNEAVKTQSTLRLTGAFNSMLPVWLNENRAKNLLTGSATDEFSNLSANETSLSVTLNGKLTAGLNSGYYSFLLPEASGGANSWNMTYLTASRKSELAIPYVVDETYTYTVSFSEGKQPVNKTGVFAKENKCGKVNISIELLSPGQIKITRMLQLKQNSISPSGYSDFAELMKLWQNTNYRTVVYR